MTKTLSLLYELSLAVGTSLELEQNASHFLGVLMRRLNIDFASLWLKDNVHNDDIDKSYQLSYAYPEFRVKKRSLELDDAIFNIPKKKKFSVLDNSTFPLTDYIDFNPEEDHFLVVYQLENYGYLIFFSNAAWEKEFNTQFRQLKDLIQKFSLSIEASIAYQKSLIDAKNNEHLVILAKEKEQAILSMATPISQLWENILLLPLVGVIDYQRVQQMLTIVLQKISDSQSKILILDISGTASIDELAINLLLKVIKSARLMGCTCLLSGVSPDVAETIVLLDLDLENVLTVGSMKDALDKALSLTGQKLQKIIKPKKSKQPTKTKT